MPPAFPSRRTFALGLAGLAAGVSVLALRRDAGAADYMHGHGWPYDAFDRMPKTRIDIGGSRIDLAFAPGKLDLTKAQIEAWVRRSARAVALYYGHFPVDRLRVLIVPVYGRGVVTGSTYGYRGAATRIAVAHDAGAQDLVQDWVMVHEMVHTALPQVGERHNWLAEGLAVYIESIARVQAGDRTPQGIWTDFVHAMPKGLPGFGDEGLDRTHSWGRTYWGGALFCLLADIRIRQQTSNRKGLQDAVRGVLAAGGNYTWDWPVARVFAAGDKATGTSVLEEMYDAMANRPVSPNLDKLWRDLGIVDTGGLVTFNDGAPLANIRQAITTPPPDASPRRT